METPFWALQPDDQDEVESALFISSKSPFEISHVSLYFPTVEAWVFFVKSVFYSSFELFILSHACNHKGYLDCSAMVSEFDHQVILRHSDVEVVAFNAVAHAKKGIYIHTSTHLPAVQYS